MEVLGSFEGEGTFSFNLKDDNELKAMIQDVEVRLQDLGLMCGGEPFETYIKWVEEI